jgi:hypothetical protein
MRPAHWRLAVALFMGLSGVVAVVALYLAGVRDLVAHAGLVAALLVYEWVFLWRRARD